MSGFISTSWMWQPSEATNDGTSPIEINRTRQMDGSIKYAGRQSGACLSKSGVWQYEPMPSSRSEEFLKEFRFDSWPEAAAAIEKHCKPQGRFAR